jgi:hypothetical protein
VVNNNECSDQIIFVLAPTPGNFLQQHGDAQKVSQLKNDAPSMPIGGHYPDVAQRMHPEGGGGPWPPSGEVDSDCE